MLSLVNLPGGVWREVYRREYLVMKDYMKIYQEWLSNPYFDEETKAELRAIAGDENEIKERF